MLLTIIILAISLSMDTFSLSMSYGMLKYKKDVILKIALTVGAFHFFMPILGHKIGDFIVNIIHIDLKYIIIIVFLLLIIEMIASLKNEETEIRSFKLIEILGFSLAVSIDSFTIGIGLEYITNNIILSCSIFAIFSAVFTYFGFRMGNKLNKLLGKYSKILGIIFLSLLLIKIAL